MTWDHRLGRVDPTIDQDLLEIEISFLKLIENRRILRLYYSVRDAIEATHLDSNIENDRSRGFLKLVNGPHKAVLSHKAN